MVLAAVCLVCAGLPLALMLINMPIFRRPRGDGERRRVSVLVPARDEEANLPELLRSLAGQTGVDVEIIACDDHSTDRTAEIVRDSGVARLIEAPELPMGWNGKQHACWVLAQHSSHEILCWIDADVRLAGDAIAAAAAFLARSQCACVSGFPREITRSPLERMLLPLIHFILLGYLPLPAMRAGTAAAFAAGCGQFMLAERAAYFGCGGHAAIRESRHDGITLPRLFRRHGLRTDIFDATALAHCRMYAGAHATWNGLLKNATEGIAAPGAIGPFTVLLFFGQILPFALVWRSRLFVWAALFALGARALCALRYRQSWLGVVLHPLSVLLLMMAEWQALFLQASGRRVDWRGRAG